MYSMDSQIFLNGVDISDDVINYKVETHICTGIGTFEMQIVERIVTASAWDEIIIYEYGTKMYTLYVSTVKRDNKGRILLSGQDTSKKLQDYFIDQSYELQSASRCKTWINNFLDMAGVNYTYTVSGQGQRLPPYYTMGMDTVYNQVMQLLQMNGWYIVFDADGNAVIGTTDTFLEDDGVTITDDDIDSIKIVKDDKMLRNRAIVWGNVDESGQQIFVELTRMTGYEYDEDDIRTVALGCGGCYDRSDTNYLAKMMLDEFAKITEVKTVTLVNWKDNLFLGQTINLSSQYWSGKGFCTSILNSMNEEGLVKTVIIDERCPRLFGIYGEPHMPGDDGPLNPNTDVWIGTWGEGVWKKSLRGSTWYNSSTGLTNLYIKDLAIRAGVMACVTNDGKLFTRATTSAAWTQFNPDAYLDMDGEIYYLGNVSAVACAISPNFNIIAAFNYDLPDPDTGADVRKSWLVTLDMDGKLIRLEQVSVAASWFSGFIEDWTIHDVDAKSNYNIVTTGGADAERLVYNPYFGTLPADCIKRTVRSYGPANTPDPENMAVLSLAAGLSESNVYIYGPYAVAWAVISTADGVNAECVLTRVTIATGELETYNFSISGWSSGRYVYIFAEVVEQVTLATVDVSTGAVTMYSYVLGDASATSLGSAGGGVGYTLKEQAFFCDSVYLLFITASDPWHKEWVWLEIDLNTETITSETIGADFQTTPSEAAYEGGTTSVQGDASCFMVNAKTGPVYGTVFRRDYFEATCVLILGVCMWIWTYDYSEIYAGVDLVTTISNRDDFVTTVEPLSTSNYGEDFVYASAVWALENGDYWTYNTLNSQYINCTFRGIYLPAGFQILYGLNQTAQSPCWVAFLDGWLWYFDTNLGTEVWKVADSGEGYPSKDVDDYAQVIYFRPGYYSDIFTARSIATGELVTEFLYNGNASSMFSIYGDLLVFNNDTGGTDLVWVTGRWVSNSGDVLKVPAVVSSTTKINPTGQTLTPSRGAFTIIRDGEGSTPLRVEMNPWLPTNYLAHEDDANRFSEPSTLYKASDTLGSFVEYGPNPDMYDVRGSYIIPDEFPLPSGQALTQTGGYTFIAEPDKIELIRDDLSGAVFRLASVAELVASGVADGVAGNISHLETTCYTIAPLVCFSVSGAGSSDFFMQRNVDSTWHQYSSTLPEAHIKVIKIGDEV